jgi:hypothetical protein
MGFHIEKAKASRILFLAALACNARAMVDFTLPWRIGAWARTTCFCLAGLAAQAADLDGARVNEIVGWVPPKPVGLGRPIADRAAWDKLARAAAFAGVVPNAQTLAGQPVPELREARFLDYSQTGNRDRCQKVLAARAGRIVSFTLATPGKKAAVTLNITPAAQK